MTRSMPFPGPSRPHVNNVGLADRARRGDPPRDGRAVRDRGDFPGIDVEAQTQALTGRARHDNHLSRHRRDLLEHRTLMRGGVFEDRVGDHDRRDAQPADDVDHFVSVDAAVDAVFVLHDRNVAPVQQV